MKKIVIDARIINSSTGRYVERLLHFLEEIDHENDYTILVPTKDLQYYVPKNPHFSVLAADFDSYSFNEQIGFLQFLNNLNADLVHFCMPQQPILYRRPHVTTVHDLTLLTTYNSDKNYLIFKAKQFVGRFVFRRIGKTSARIFTPTQFVKDAYAAFSRIDPDKITVTYEAAGITTDISQEYQPMVGKQYIMYVGQQSDYKNIRRLMQAHQQLRQKMPDLQLVLVGKMTGKNGAPLVTNQKWAEEQGFQGILFTDFLPDAQVRWLMEHTLAYVFPSLSEGFGLPPLDAMTYGAPVVSSNATCLPEVYKDAAEYFDPLDTDDMTLAIERVITNTELQNTLRIKGKRQAAKYSWRRMAEQTHTEYSKILHITD